MFKELFTESTKPSREEILKLYKKIPKRYSYTDALDSITAALMKKSKMKMNDIRDIVAHTLDEIDETNLTEGTQASITVLTKNGEYRTSILQYDGYPEFMKKELKYFDNQKDAEKLVQKTGEIRGIDHGDVEYYYDRSLLAKTKDEQKAVKNANEIHYKYFFDGDDWYFAKGQIRSFNDMKKL